MHSNQNTAVGLRESLGIQPGDTGASPPMPADCSTPVVGYLPFCYMTIAQVIAAVGISASRVYELIKLGEFPPGDLIGKQSRRWKSTNIAAWLIEQSEQSAQRQADLAPALKRKANRAANISASNRAARAAGIRADRGQQ